MPETKQTQRRSSEHRHGKIMSCVVMRILRLQTLTFYQMFYKGVTVYYGLEEVLISWLMSEESPGSPTTDLFSAFSPQRSK